MILSQKHIKTFATIVSHGSMEKHG